MSQSDDRVQQEVFDMVQIIKRDKPEQLKAMLQAIGDRAAVVLQCLTFAEIKEAGHAFLFAMGSEKPMQTPLGIAADLGRTACAEQLLAAGACPNSSKVHEPDGAETPISPLVNAIRCPSSDMVDVLSKAGADPLHPGNGHCKAEWWGISAFQVALEPQVPADIKARMAKSIGSLSRPRVFRFVLNLASCGRAGDMIAALDAVKDSHPGLLLSKMPMPEGGDLSSLTKRPDADEQSFCDAPLLAPRGTLQENLAALDPTESCTMYPTMDQWAEYEGGNGSDFSVGMRIEVPALRQAASAIKRAAVQCHGSIHKLIAILCERGYAAGEVRKRYKRTDRLLAFRRCHEAKRDAGMVVQAASHGRPMELAKRLRLGVLAGGLEMEGEVKDGAGGTRVVGPLEAARLGGHDECVKVLAEAALAQTKAGGSIKSALKAVMRVRKADQTWLDQYVEEHAFDDPEDPDWRRQMRSRFRALKYLGVGARIVEKEERGPLLG